MLDYIFNMELPLPVKLVVAFAIVLALLGIVAWLFKRFGGSRIGTTTARGRQPRLAVIDAAAVDSRRRLVLIRRDNVEHLVMIGGPTDVLIEQNIVPVLRSTDSRLDREIPPRPPRPEPMARPPRPDPSARRPASDFDRPRVDQVAPRPRPAPAEFSRPQRMEPAPPSFDAPLAGPNADANLANMANKLEAALRRPGSARRPEPEFGPPTLTEPTPPTAPELNGNGNGNGHHALPAPSPRSEAAPESKPGQADAKAGGGKSVFDSLEEEMASLLGRPPDTPEKK
jgi:flagellar protein FliO/FliZ